MIAFLSRWEKLWKVDRYDKINYTHILSRVFTILKIIILSKTIFLKSDCVDLLDRSRSIQKVNCFLFELILITPINYIDLLDRHLFYFFFFFVSSDFQRIEPSRSFWKFSFPILPQTGPTHGPTLFDFYSHFYSKKQSGPTLFIFLKVSRTPFNHFFGYRFGGHQRKNAR